MKKVTDISQVPKHLTDQEEAEFWDTHECTEEFLMEVTDDEEEDDDLLPTKRSKTISIRMDQYGL